MNGSEIIKWFVGGLVLCVIVFSLGSMQGCNFVARNIGGTQTITLKKGQKFVNATWKETSLWILTRNSTECEPTNTYIFKEFSNLGILEGKVIIKEQ